MIALCAMGCFSLGKTDAEQVAGDDSGGGGGSGSGSGAPNQALCSVDEDCAPAAATCCDCPTFATRADDPLVTSCADVECGGGQCESDVAAVCSNGACRLACPEIACPASCEYGYKLDDTACMTCECAAPEVTECRADTECVQTAADCCGCQQGGKDTAVPAGTEDAYHEMMGCPASPQCPQVDTCVGDQAPHCVQGSCELIGPLPADACGRPDLPACGGGAACVVNVSDQANMHRVGVCR